MAEGTDIKEKIKQLKEMVEGNDNYLDVAKETVLDKFTGSGTHIPLYPIEIEFRNLVKQLKTHNALYLQKLEEMLTGE